MGILSWLVLGLIAGFVGSKIVGDTGQGLLVTSRSESSARLSADFCSLHWALTASPALTSGVCSWQSSAR